MEVHKCKFIICPKFTRKHWFFALFLVGGFLRVFFPDLLIFIIDKFGKKKENENKTDNEKSLEYHLLNKYFEIIRNIISDLFLGFCHCYYIIRDKNYRKKSQQTYNNSSHAITFIFNDNTPRNKKMFKILFIISFVDIVCQLIIPIKYIFDKIFWKDIFDTDPSHLYLLLFFDIFARYFFSLWILKTYFYCHHYFSLILNIIGLGFIGIIDILHKILPIEENKFNILYISLLSIQTILYSFEDIMNKVAFRTLYISPNTLIFYKGLVQLIYLAVISVFFFCFYFDSKFLDLQFEFQKFVCFVPFNCIRTYFLVKVIDKFSAQHMALLRVSETIIIFVYGKISSLVEFRKNPFVYEEWQISIQIVGFIFLLLSTLIHNEIIIINHPKLRAKTEYYLDKDADKEQQSSFNTDTTFTDSKDTSINSENTENGLFSDLTGSDIS